MKNPRWRKALNLVNNPEIIEATARHYEQANDFFARRDFARAQQHYESALALVPNYAQARHNLGDLLMATGNIPAAIAHYEQALVDNPQLAKTHYSLATAQLISGNFAAGWKDYEWRWANKNLPHPRDVIAVPLWNGSITDQKILLWGEQGIGDEIMFAGFIPEILSRGQSVILKCANARLLPLFRRSFPDVEVIHEITNQKFAAHLPLGDLPRLLHPQLDHYRAPQGYLKADTEKQKDFRVRYAQDKKRIGISWHSNSAATGWQRSVALAELAPLFALPGIEWISLQYGDAQELKAEAARANAPLIFDGDVNPSKDLDLFAAQIASLDAVVTIDNAAAHIAGALGVPAYVLLPYAPDWRWFLGRADSPWYPGMHLFRQHALNDWESAIRALAQKIATRA